MGFWSSIFGKRGSYFLDDESAKGMGDTEYMKQSKAVRRTFPAGGGGESFEVTKQVSAIDKEIYDSRKGDIATPAATPSYASTSSSSFGNSSFGSSSFGSTPAAETPAAEDTDKAPEPSFQPSRSTNVDTSMDMFRNMAKKVGR